PAMSLGDLMEALVRVHHDNSDRKNRAHARFKFVAESLGVQRIRELVLERWSPPVGVQVSPATVDTSTAAVLSPTGAHPQADGRVRVMVPLIAGDIATEDVRLVVNAAERHGASGLLLGTRQNIALPDVLADNAAGLTTELETLGFAPAGWNGPRDMVACPGTDQCRKAFVETRNFAHELAAALERANVADWAQRLRIGLAGCPNSCTHPNLNDLGFRGAVGVVDGKKKQGFDFLLGGRVLDGTQLGEEAARYLGQDEVIAVVVAAAEVYARFARGAETFAQVVRRAGLRFVARRIAEKVTLGYGHWTELARLIAPAPEAGLSVLNASMDGASPREILEWGVRTYGEKLLVTTALNAGGVLLLQYLKEIAPQHPVYFVDTGKHFKETLDYRDNLIRDFGFNIVTLGPELAEAEFARRHGGTLWEKDADRCCFLRKVLPLQKVREGKLAWLSALRREQGGERASIGCLSCDTDGMLRVQPLIARSRDDVDGELELFGIPQHPLREQGYTSIGCSPCTLPPLPGMGERGGRWAGTKKTECGLHRFDRSAVAGVAP
ncbi:MAG: phosphoadenylyl-sulfate reductase, partial [Planctomycetes bacterium]|nr:phosphoadenylyl-sulfate reductase [Planctomycetota bacterium]